MEESLPPGFRFHPTDEELITHYLCCKVSDVCFTSKAIADVDLNKCEPWDLPGKASMGEKEWYFFNLRDRKYPTGMRTNRATEAGYWKTTGKDKEVYRGGILVGMKKTLVFYRGRAPKGEKTNWVMHEYRLENKHSFKPTKEEWVVCRVFQKSIVKKPQQMPTLEQSCDTNDVGDTELPNLNNIANSSPAGFSNMIDPSNNMNMNWHTSTTTSFPSWPIASSSSNLMVNSLLLKALQLRTNYQQQREADYSYLEPQGISGFGMTGMSSNFEASSSSRVLDPSQPHQEQPFNLDSIW